MVFLVKLQRDPDGLSVLVVDEDGAEVAGYLSPTGTPEQILAAAGRDMAAAFEDRPQLA
jgi:hypothetical protein